MLFLKALMFLIISKRFPDLFIFQMCMLVNVYMFSCLLVCVLYLQAFVHIFLSMGYNDYCWLSILFSWGESVVLEEDKLSELISRNFWLVNSDMIQNLYLPGYSFIEFLPSCHLPEKKENWGGTVSLQKHEPTFHTQ